MYDLKNYDEEYFTILFDVTNKIEIRKIHIDFRGLLNNNDAKNLFVKIVNFETQNTISNEVSFCFTLFLWLDHGHVLTGFLFPLRPHRKINGINVIKKPLKMVFFIKKTYLSS